ncbi:MAG: hypothetical protein MJ156_02310 [Alphaproteobacteria bacterium]|nr:hypothetical protein [Alphaproteobacteria bacterium]
MNIIFVAEQREADHIEKLPNTKVFVTRPGMFAVANTVTKLLLNKEISKDDKFFNIGYCGSNISPIGKIHRVSVSASEEKSNYADYKDIKLCDGDVVCFSANNFVTQTEHKGIFDMELYVLANMLPEIAAYKIVSDCLDLDTFNQISVEDSWKEMNEILKEIIG